MSEESKPLSQQIIDLGDEFPIDAMNDFDERMKSGEFADKTPEQIRAIYLDEAIQAESDAEDAESIRAIEDAEQAELDRSLDGDDDDC